MERMRCWADAARGHPTWSVGRADDVPTLLGMLTAKDEEIERLRKRMSQQRSHIDSLLKKIARMENAGQFDPLIPEPEVDAAHQPYIAMVEAAKARGDIDWLASQGLGKGRDKQRTRLKNARLRASLSVRHRPAQEPKS